MSVLGVASSPNLGAQQGCLQECPSFPCAVIAPPPPSFFWLVLTWVLTYGCGRLALLRPKVSLGCISTMLLRPSAIYVRRREGLCASSTLKSRGLPKPTPLGTAMPSR